MEILVPIIEEILSSRLKPEGGELALVKKLKEELDDLLPLINMLIYVCKTNM